MYFENKNNYLFEKKMFNFITSYFRGEKINKDLVKPHINLISKTSNYDELKETFENLLPNIPLDNYYSIDEYSEIFSEFDHDQINNFSNNICTLIESQMKEKIGQLNYSAELLLNFTISIFTKINTVRTLITKSYNNILDKNNDIIKTISKSFPFNIFILCVNSITNDDFFFRQDIFQKEVDKFDFSYRLINIMFCISHICDSNPTKSSQSSIEYIDIIKIFLLNTKENLFISKKNQISFLVKLYNTSVHNFETLMNNKINPIYDKKKFEKFIFMNIYLLWYLLCDRNRNILSELNTNSKIKNTFNIKTISIISSLLNIKNEDNINTVVQEYNNNYSLYIKEELLKANDKFMSFIQNAYTNMDYLSGIAKKLIKVIILYVFDIYPDFCEMICLKKALIGKILENICPTNAYDLMLLYTFSKSMNFYIAIKQSKLTLEQMFLNCIINYLDQKKNNQVKFTYSLYYSLLSAKNISYKIKYLSELSQEKLKELEKYINDIEINSECFYDNLITLTLYFQIDYGIVTSLDVPSKFIFSRIKRIEEIKRLILDYKEFYKNNLEYETKGKKTWEKFDKISVKYIKFYENIIKEIKENGLDIELSTEEDIINIINRKTYKASEELDEDNKVPKSIFHSETEKFIISSVYGNELYKILNY